ncbi:MAG: NADH-quinone oxidoreductase subunit NuoF [Clostridiaceae bacterium]|nr:NADH-quinone oxidoreductase subunit NuoF [Clostridiaceae bacterium]
MSITIEKLNEIREQTFRTMNLRGLPSDRLSGPYKWSVVICMGTGCTSSKSPMIRERLRALIERDGLGDEIEIVGSGCFGLCEAGPVVIVHPGGVFYSHLEVADIDRIYEEHLVGGEPVLDLIYADAKTEDGLLSYAQVPFTAHQKRVALRNSGHIDPENIREYIALGGYRALHKALKEMTPEEVIEVVSASGLRGRGGGGFPAGRKWHFTRLAVGDEKFVICNADEGDPGAFMDRSILEGDPHTVLEAMVIAGYAVGAHQGYVYIRAEYPIAVHRLEIAIEQATDMGLMGDDIFGTGFSFNVELRLGAGAFVCGEETALIASIEGQRGMPRTKPPFPANQGLWDKPTLINNVETFANIPVILNKGAEEFRKIGTEKSPGTKVFALGGKIKNVGLVEIPMGMTLRQVIEDIGGGCPNGKKFKAVQTGGPSGGCIGEEKLDTPIDFDSLTAVGSMMGSGGMIVMDEDNCAVDVARFYMEFIAEESCGKCTPCREGTTRMLEILQDITEGRGDEDSIPRLERLAKTAQRASLCALGQTSANPVLSTIRTFRDEYETHIKEKRCPAGVCQALTSYFITDKCIGCTRCARNCPVACIDGEVKKLHVIRQDECIKCGTCMEVCPVGAVIRR